jgi:uncharacterized membrane protein YfcA
LAGLNPLAANVMSTIALFPSQITAAAASRRLAGNVGRLGFVHLFVISLAGGLLGAILLLNTPPIFFAGLVP